MKFILEFIPLRLPQINSTYQKNNIQNILELYFSRNEILFRVRTVETTQNESNTFDEYLATIASAISCEIN